MMGADWELATSCHMYGHGRRVGAGSNGEGTNFADGSIWEVDVICRGIHCLVRSAVAPGLLLA